MRVFYFSFATTECLSLSNLEVGKFMIMSLVCLPCSQGPLLSPNMAETVNKKTEQACCWGLSSSYKANNATIGPPFLWCHLTLIVSQGLRSLNTINMIWGKTKCEPENFREILQTTEALASYYIKTTGRGYSCGGWVSKIFPRLMYLFIIVGNWRLKVVFNIKIVFSLWEKLISWGFQGDSVPLSQVSSCLMLT